MNKFTFLSCLIILISINLKAQQQVKAKPDEPAKKSSKIIVLVRDTANTLLNRLSGILFDKGYTIDTKDEKVKYVTTKAMQGKKWSTYYIVRARINDTSIVFTSQISLHKDGGYWDVDYRGSKISALREAWNELDGLARLFGDKITYSK